MKNLISYFLVCLFLFSCKKDPALKNNHLQPQEKKYPVTFNVADFTPEIVGTSKVNTIAEVPLAGRAGRLTYIAYDSQGEEVSRIIQDSTGHTSRISKEFGDISLRISDQAFGCIKDTLAAGKYNVIMLASRALYSINIRNEDTFGYSFLTFPEAHFNYNRGLDSWSRAEDTFFKKFSLDLTKDESPHKITLDRIVGKAEFHILDSKPGTFFRFFFINENEAFKFSDELPFGITDDVGYDAAPFIPGKINLSFSKFLINTATPVDVLINVYENANGDPPIASKTVKGVRFYKNKRTKLTGNIYTDPSATTGFSVKVNDQFDPDSINVSF